MHVKLTNWILMLALLGLVVPRLIGADALIWYNLIGGGGPGNVAGTVNLPGAKSCISISSLSPAGEKTVYDLGYKISIPETLRLNLPSNMSRAVAILTDHGVPISLSAVSGAVILSGEDLLMVRDAGLMAFGFTLISPEETCLTLLIELEPRSSKMRLLIR